MITVEVELDAKNALDQINIDEVIAHYGQEHLLDTIGIDEVVRHMGEDIVGNISKREILEKVPLADIVEYVRNKGLHVSDED